MRGRVLVVDQDRCDGCRRCEEACSLHHTGKVDCSRSRISVFELEDRQLFVPSTCQHCERPFCAEACPTGACRRDPATHAVIIDPNVCMGCKTCVVACLFGGPRFDEELGVSVKCEYCAGDPACVAACAPGALSYVFADENNIRRRRISGARYSGWVAKDLSPGEGGRPVGGTARAGDGDGDPVAEAAGGGSRS